jgi:hypothetical protein
LDKESRPKKRYWLWRIKSKTTGWYKHSSYMDDDGNFTDGYIPYSKKNWNDMEKIKHESEFIDV